MTLQQEIIGALNRNADNTENIANILEEIRVELKRKRIDDADRFAARDTS